MPATFPIPHCTVLLGSGGRFETEHVEHLYNLHLELHEAYPLLPLGGFRLDLVEENEEEERAIFQLVMDPYHLQTDVMLEEMGDVWIFEIMFSWWLREQEEDGAYDSWSVYVAVDPDSIDRFYGCLDETHTTITSWHLSLNALLSTESYGEYSDKVVQSIECEIDQFMKEVNQ